MSTLLPQLLLGLAISTGVLRPPSASSRAATTGTCSQDSRGSRLLLKQMQATATGTAYPYPDIRDLWHIPAVAASEVVLVTDATICGRAAQAYDSVVVARGGQAASNRAVIVVRIGDQFAVQDLLERNGEWSVTMLFDSAFSYLSGW